MGSASAPSDNGACRAPVGGPLDSPGEFEAQRPRLMRLAYRMLGSVADAEDIVQDAFIRWSRAERDTIANPPAYLARVVTRLCLDQIKSARVRRESYIGPWLPEPVADHPELSGESASDYALDLSVGLLLAMERLSPLERAAYLLHDIFDVDFDEIGSVLGRTPAASRQLAARARAHIKAGRPRFPVSRNEGEAMAEAFRSAADTGDAKALGRLLAADAVLLTDGGGKRLAALNPIRGALRVARFFQGVARKSPRSRPFRLDWINGLPGYVTLEHDGLVQTTALQIQGGLVSAVYVTRNPDKLQRIKPPG